MFGKLKSSNPTCPTTLPTAWASSLRLWALRKTFESMGAVKDSRKISTLKASDLTDYLISSDGNVNVERFKAKHITKWRWFHTSFMGTFLSTSYPHHWRGPSHLFALWQLPPPWSKFVKAVYSKLMRQKSSQGSKYLTKSKHVQADAFYLCETSGCLLFLLCFAKLQQKKKQKKPTFLSLISLVYLVTWSDPTRHLC